MNLNTSTSVLCEMGINKHLKVMQMKSLINDPQNLELGQKCIQCNPILGFNVNLLLLFFLPIDYLSVKFTCYH